MKLKIIENLCLVEMYVGPNTREADLEMALKSLKGRGSDQVIITGDLNARQKSWDTCRNARGREVLKSAAKWKYQVTSTDKATYRARGRKGESKIDLLVDTDKVSVTNPRNVGWYDSSDHTQILYKIDGVNIRRDK